MAAPQLSAHFAGRKPSVIRLAQIEFAKRRDDTEALNVAIGNVSLPMHPAMQRAPAHPRRRAQPLRRRRGRATAPPSAWRRPTAAFLNIIASSGFATDGLHSQVTDGGSQAMELVIVGCCGPAGSDRAAAAADRRGLHQLQGLRRAPGPPHRVDHPQRWATTAASPCPSLAEIEAIIVRHRPGAMVVIPYDNPTGQLYDRATLRGPGPALRGARPVAGQRRGLPRAVLRGRRRGQHLGPERPEVPGHRRPPHQHRDAPQGLERLRPAHRRAGHRQRGVPRPGRGREHGQPLLQRDRPVHLRRPGPARATPTCRPGTRRQRDYYRAMLRDFTAPHCASCCRGSIVSSPDARIYSVVDVRNIAPADFDALEFVLLLRARGQVRGRRASR